MVSMQVSIPQIHGSYGYDIGGASDNGRQGFFKCIFLLNEEVKEPQNPQNYVVNLPIFFPG